VLICQPQSGCVHRRNPFRVEEYEPAVPQG
jgi:hypothetical protein